MCAIEGNDGGIPGTLAAARAQAIDRLRMALAPKPRFIFRPIGHESNVGLSLPGWYPKSSHYGRPVGSVLGVGDLANAFATPKAAVVINSAIPGLFQAAVSATGALRFKDPIGAGIGCTPRRFTHQIKGSSPTSDTFNTDPPFALTSLSKVNYMADTIISVSSRLYYATMSISFRIMLYAGNQLLL